MARKKNVQPQIIFCLLRVVRFGFYMFSGHRLSAHINCNPITFLLNYLRYQAIIYFGLEVAQITLPSNEEKPTRLVS